MKLPLIFFTIIFLGCETAGEKENFTWDEYYHYLAAISHDSTMGRAPGTLGYGRTAAYCASLFDNWGLHPAGENKSYYQTLRLKVAKKAESTFYGNLNIDGKNIPLLHRKNFNPMPLITRTSTNIKEVPIVFAGFGIDAPELNHNDFKDIDVNGKVVLVAYGAPKEFNNEASAIYTYNKQGAKKHGAIGVITFAPPYMPINFTAVDEVFQSSMCWVDGESKYSDNVGDLEIYGMVENSLAKEILGVDELNSIVDSLRSGWSLGRPLKSKITAKVDYMHSEVTSSNVISKIPGTDEKLRNEVIVISAHLDHIGVGAPIDGDSIYNGTMDNASGSAAVLSIAHKMSSEKPNKRSIVFALVAAEEEGLLGSDYLVTHPPNEVQKIVANINIDGLLGLRAATKDYVPFGYQYSTISTSIDRALEKMDMKLGEDKFPEEAYFVRSDQFSFVKHGIPAIFSTAGYEASDSTINLEALSSEWNRSKLHSPFDDLRQAFDPNGAVRELNLNYYIIQDLANREEEIKWVEGSYLYSKYVKK